MPTRMMNVVSAKNHTLVEISHVVASHGRASNVMDVQCLQGHELSHSVALFVDSNAGRSPRDFQTFDRQVLRAGEIESVLAGVRPAE